MKTLTVLLLTAFLAAPAHAEDSDSPFRILPSIVQTNGATVIAVSIRIPREHHVYADRLSFELNGHEIAAALPGAKQVQDKFSGKQKSVFEKDFVALLPLSNSSGVLLVNFQGCSDSECYFPETRTWKLNPDQSFAAVTDSADIPPAVTATDASLTNGFQIAARSSGFLSAQEFLRFLNASEAAKGDPTETNDGFAGAGTLATAGLILLGGLALNLTPCVLPMIPINLAILGAGARNQNRRRGFALGSIYGGGMAFAYGALGLVVVLTGSKFGTLNSSAWFNFSIAAVFVVLGLAMFDRLAIDLSRFQRAGGNTSRSSKGAFLAAGMMGSFSALLAGACVAPVVISVLLLATTLYQKGSLLGLALPFVLGLGMALPWPFAGAGLSFLPRPGAWMTRVKYAFGVIIFGFAIWYGWLGWNLAGFGSKSVLAKSDADQELRAALEQSRQTGKPVVVDFWASWCKNCEAMEHTTFCDATVQQRLKNDFILVKFQAERLNDSGIKPVLDQFGVMGLPTCVVIRPETAKASPAL